MYTSVKGTKESDICAFRGTCSATGVCSCYNTNGDSYGSSDGYGNPGSLGQSFKLVAIVRLFDVFSL